MRGVTVRADGAGKKTFFDQALTMHTARVVDKRIPGIGSDGGRMINFAMTAAAKLRDVCAVCFISLVQMR